jgi:ribosome-binding factor A
MRRALLANPQFPVPNPEPRITNHESRISNPGLIMPSKSFTRTDRVASQLRKELAVLVHAAVRDHALPSVSVSDVEVTKDLDAATVYVTTLLPDSAKTATAALNEMAGAFRTELSRTLRIRRVPALRFRYDDSVDKGERIESLLREEAKK